ncbi:hypothetical protein [Pelovirga terrestris]|uniref:Uncharacterized protein n=1 Tax=Pelovirga terrestris TaxID=2771352 RepID=A0A8J6URP7_9BACT|nr:hypothetical protein [Pelovirga terrestris]MBD1401731.1 hypothetical protein [Pelovirga terrestris]
MNRIHNLCLALVLAPLLIGGIILLEVMGFETSLLTKLFIVFAGTIVGFQCAPAVLLFSGLIKETCEGRNALGDKSTR